MGYSFTNFIYFQTFNKHFHSTIRFIIIVVTAAAIQEPTSLRGKKAEHFTHT